MTQLISAIIATMLLVLYAVAVVRLTRAPNTPPSEAVQTVLSLVGGLVSALVVAVLAVTPAGGSPTHAFAAAALVPTAQAILEYIVGAYLVVWLGCGAWLLVTWIWVADATPALASAAKSWLGLAVAAAAGYLSLK